MTFTGAGFEKDSVLPPSCRQDVNSRQSGGVMRALEHWGLKAIEMPVGSRDRASSRFAGNAAARLHMLVR